MMLNKMALIGHNDASCSSSEKNTDGKLLETDIKSVWNLLAETHPHKSFHKISLVLPLIMQDYTDCES